MPRTIAIGDVHGCSVAFNSLLDLVAPEPDDVIVTLGDYIDRGPDSKGVIDRLIRLASECQLVPLRGNHEAALLAAAEGRLPLASWVAIGGGPTLESYGATDVRGVSPRHLEFLESCKIQHETDSHFFCHANYLSVYDLDAQDEFTQLWLSLREYVPEPHPNGKIAVVGHTPHYEGVMDLGHLICIDTACCFGGCLSALDVETDDLWQVGEDGIPFD
ncbi:MAG: metallophosphoesterase [Planctomycetales bacterium]